MSLQKLMDSSQPSFKMDEIKKRILKNPELLKQLDRESNSKLLQKAIEYDFLDLIKLIIEYKVDATPLELALVRGDVTSVEALLSSGEKLKDLEWDFSLLAKCIFDIKNRKDMLTLLLKYGLNMDAVNREGKNLFHIFAESVGENDQDALEIAEILTSYGVSINELDEFGNTPLIQAIFNNNFELVSFLVTHGANVDLKGGLKKSPLDLAVDYCNKNVIDLLVSSGADINATDDCGDTALHQACLFFKEEIIILLIRKCADCTVVNSKGESAFCLLDSYEEYLVSREYLSCVRAFLKEFAKLTFENRPIPQVVTNLLQENLEYHEYFQKCIDEMKRMASLKFYEFFTYYSVLKMSKNMSKLVPLTMNEDFVIKFRENLNKFTFYRNDLHRIFEEAVKLKNEALLVYSRLSCVFDKFLPEVVLKKLAKNLTVKDLPLDN